MNNLSGNYEKIQMGLSHEEAAARLMQYGRNELLAPSQRSWLRIARSVLAEPMFLLLTCLLIYRWALQSGQSVDLARTLTFLTLTAGNLMMIRIIASRKFSFVNFFDAQHRAYWLIAGVSVTLVTIFIAIPWLRGVFYFAVPSLQQSAIVIVGGLLAGAALDLVKWHPWVYRTLGGTSKR